MAAFEGQDCLRFAQAEIGDLGPEAEYDFHQNDDHAGYPYLVMFYQDCLVVLGQKFGQLRLIEASIAQNGDCARNRVYASEKSIKAMDVGPNFSVTVISQKNGNVNSWAPNEGHHCLVSFG